MRRLYQGYRVCQKAAGRLSNPSRPRGQALSSANTHPRLGKSSSRQFAVVMERDFGSGVRLLCKRILTREQERGVSPPWLHDRDCNGVRQRAAGRQCAEQLR